MSNFTQLRERRQTWGDRKYAVVHPDTGETVNAGRAGLRNEWKDIAEELADALNILDHVITRAEGHYPTPDVAVLPDIRRYILMAMGAMERPGVGKSPTIWGHDYPELNIKRIGWND